MHLFGLKLRNFLFVLPALLLVPAYETEIIAPVEAGIPPALYLSVGDQV